MPRPCLCPSIPPFARNALSRGSKLLADVQGPINGVREIPQPYPGKIPASLLPVEMVGRSYVDFSDHGLSPCTQPRPRQTNGRASNGGTDEISASDRDRSGCRLRHVGRGLRLQRPHHDRPQCAHWAGAGHAKVGTLPAGFRVNVTGCQPGWCKIHGGGLLGWASAGYIERSHVVGPPVIIVRPPHRPPHWQHRPHHRPPHHRPPHKPRPGKCKIAPGFSCK
ncbi:SH3 domain-containing protein [Mesorhizobium sp. AR07]|uniref:SH3 domain-containing protein n=1 Tax=Mesorhizobium sp. AR07 TaxID=2865838 RepID=UPI0029E80E0E|nr:SH3 domain-containing protein [Mesorhizobium sp. AR07]